MSHHQYPPPNHPPYGQPPPTQGYYGPPPGGQYNRPAPPPPPPQQGGYYGGPPPPQGNPPQGLEYGHHSPQPPYPQQHGYAPPPGGPGGFPPHPPYGPPSGSPYPPPPPQQPQFAPPVPPSPGFVPGQAAPGDFRPQADALRKAMKGFGTDEKALIHVLAKLDPLQVAAVRATYSSHLGRDLYKDVKSETSGYLRQGLLAIIDGPLMHDTSCMRDAVQGIGTKEWLLNDILLGRSNADLEAIKAAYQRTFGRSLAKDVEGDLSFKTAGLFSAVILAQRHEESLPINTQAMENEARTIHDATSARLKNNVVEVCSVFARSSDTELRAINHAFAARYHSSLEKHIQKEFSGHMEDALVHMLRTATDPAMRDAELLEDCMAGAGTKDEKLVTRLVRVHWSRAHMDQVKRAYKHRYGRELVDRVRGETSGDYQRLMVAMLE